MKYNDALSYGICRLRNLKIKNPILDTELIFSKILNKSREEILINLDNQIKKNQFINFKSLLKLREKKSPIAYILGYKEFWNNKFLVNKEVLIPRPETELIVEEALKLIKKKDTKSLIDFGTGSGCIIISILKERPNCNAEAIDISKKAIKIAKTNAKMHHIVNKVKFLNINIDKYVPKKYDLVFSNPPYINFIDYKRLDEDVKFHEPRIALLGGIDGYEGIRKVINSSNKLLKLNGKLIIEIGDKQKNKSLQILKANGFYINKICKDLSGKNRVIISSKIK
tara:strand:+ start:1770 stop:2615 length:846 start_codon:yes stop_codon:yes gene_type:complete